MNATTARATMKIPDNVPPIIGPSGIPSSENPSEETNYVRLPKTYMWEMWETENAWVSSHMHTQYTVCY